MFTHCHKVFNLLGRPKVCDLHQASRVHKYVGALDVSVHDALLVQIVQPQQNLPCINSDNTLLEAACKPRSKSTLRDVGINPSLHTDRARSIPCFGSFRASSSTDSDYPLHGVGVGYATG